MIISAITREQLTTDTAKMVTGNWTTARTHMHVLHKAQDGIKLFLVSAGF